MLSWIVFWSGKKEYCAGTVDISSAPVSVYIRFVDGSSKFVRESNRFGKVNSNPAMVRPMDL